MADETGSGGLAPGSSWDASSAAFSAYWVVYRDPVWGHSLIILDTGARYWMDQFGYWHSVSKRFYAAADEEAPAPGKDTAEADGTS